MQLTGGAEGAVVAAGRHDHARLNDVGVHARLGAVRLRHQRPVGHHARHAAAAGAQGGVGLHDQVLHSGGVEQLDVGVL